MLSVSGKIHFAQCHFQVHLWYLPSVQLIEGIIDHALCLYLFDSVFVIPVFYMKNCNKVSKDMS